LQSKNGKDKEKQLGKKSLLEKSVVNKMGVNKTKNNLNS